MKKSILLISLSLFSYAQVSMNSAVTRMQGFPQETQYYTLSFKDNRLQELNVTTATDTSFARYTYISDQRVQSVETMLRSRAKNIQDFLFDAKGNLLKLTRRGEDESVATSDYHYDKRGFIQKKVSSERYANLYYETDDKGKIIKEIYADQSGYNLFIYEKDKLYAINFYNANNKYMGGMIFKEPISIKTLMLLE